MNTKLNKSQIAYECLLAIILVVTVSLTATVTPWLLYGLGTLIFLGAMMIVMGAGSDALFEHLGGLGPVSWTLSFIPYICAAFIGLLIDR